jgi:hypothetical protein
MDALRGDWGKISSDLNNALSSLREQHGEKA